MNRIVIKGFSSAFKAPFLANRSITIAGTSAAGVLSRSFGKAANEKNEGAAPERTPNDPEVMRKARDFSIPIEQLSSPEERYRRITVLNRKPYQMSSSVLNKYFKLCKEEEDFQNLQKLLRALDTKKYVLNPIAIYNLVNTLLSYKTPSEVYDVIVAHPGIMEKCDKSTFNLIINKCVESGHELDIPKVVRLSYPKWPTDASFLDHALELLVHAKRLGSAYTLALSFPPKFASASAPVLEEMLQEAVNAKDRKRAEGLYMLLKKNWNVEKPYEIVGEPERPYLKEKKHKEKKEGEEKPEEKGEEKHEEKKHEKEEKKHEKHEQKEEEKKHEKHEKKEEKHEKHEEKHEKKHEKHEKEEKKHEKHEEKHEEKKHEKKHEKEEKKEEKHN